MISRFIRELKNLLLSSYYLDDWLLARDASKRFMVVRKYLNSGSRGAELGVFKGHFSKLLVEKSDIAHFWAVDPWYLIGNWDWAGGDRCSVKGLRSALGKLRYGLKQQRVSIHIGDDLDFLRGCPDNCFDWVYLDSSHQFDHTLQELNLLQKKVKSQGYIIGDDWTIDPEHKDHGIAKAVFTLIHDKPQSFSLIYSCELNRQWVVQVL